MHNQHRACADECLTTQHTPSNAEEREAVLERGGAIPESAPGEALRVNGLIAVTRSLGDRQLKPVLSCIPEVVERKLEPKDAFLVLGSDGLFDYVTDEVVVFTPSPNCLLLQDVAPQDYVLSE